MAIVYLPASAITRFVGKIDSFSRDHSQVCCLESCIKGYARAANNDLSPGQRAFINLYATALFVIAHVLIFASLS